MTLREFFAENSKCALAFSGGADSAYLLYAAKDCGADVTAYFVKTPFQPEFEFGDAVRLAKELGAKLRIVECDPLADAAVRSNGPDRCYHCKRRIFSAIAESAAADGRGLIIDGTNASDDASDRPGMRALRELGVRSPLRECGITKPELRRLSAEAGLFTAKKPAYACLATRIPAGEAITPEKLAATEQAEAFLASLGFTDFRVRSQNGHGRIELPASQFSALLNHREAIVENLKPYYKTISLNLEARK